MSKVVSAKRYAKALLEVAKAHQAVDVIKAEFEYLVKILATNKELPTLLKHPQVEVEDKKSLLASLLKETQPLFLNFVHLMVDKGREGLLKETYEQFVSLVNQYEGIAEVSISSATELEPEVINGIANAFSKQLNKQITTTTVVDKSLLGGVKVRVGDRLYDGSIKGKLNRLSNSLRV